MDIKILAASALLISPILGQAKVTLPAFFTDSMVVQQQAEITIPGTAKKGAIVKITPSWTGETLKVKAGKDGKFEAKLTTPEAGGPFTIVFDDGQKTQLSEVLAGEVWFCSGQSNMEMPVEGWGKVMNYRQEVAQANWPNVRLLQVRKNTTYAPLADAEVNMGGWRTANPQTVGEFSSIGYFYGRQLYQELNVPIGIIDCTWGGTPIEAWCSMETLERCGEFADELSAIKASNYDATELQAQYEKELQAWNDAVIPQSLDFDQDAAQWGNMPVPSEWESTVLPAFDGVVWVRKTIELPASAAGKPAQLSLACIDDEDVTYVNGQKVGATSGYNVERKYEIPAGVLKAGKNTVLVRVLDTGGGGGIWGDADAMHLTVDGQKLALAGTWDYSIASDFSQFPPRPTSPLSSNYPTVLYNAMMHPIATMPVKGVLWYQGCANVGRDQQYSKLFKAMIEDWRAEWKNPDMPFYFVQLANYLQPKRFQPESEWAALRQAQKDALVLPGTEMAVAIDLGNPDDIHPKNKQEVARRLALCALHNQYGKQVKHRAPRMTDMKVADRNVRLRFDGDLMMHGGGNAFVVKDKDGKWAQGYARLLSPRVLEVSSDDIAHPVEVRYDWADCPDGNLRGTNGLPVAPFTTAKP
ncbi:MAG: sialate O-acetylesterase [Bacteroidales bacterium]|nr:sialate O-acetylesterase [Bacteroidales bacterium]